MNWRNISWMWVAILILIGFAGGWFGRQYSTTESPRLLQIRENSNEYTFINPLLTSSLNEESSEYHALQKKLAERVAHFLRKENATSISVYFNDLNSGAWTGVNYDAVYHPASTLKVAVLLGYLKQASETPHILAKKLEYTQKNDPGQHYPPAHPLKTNTYTATELITAMIVDSDNTALNVLYNNDKEGFLNVFKNLSIPPPSATSTVDFMSPRVYSRLFRSLYSATYLPRELSEQALKLLAYTTFKKGLVVGVPENTVVSHKFGENTDIDLLGNVTSRQLHDCGIVYYPTKPYFLCVMTKGMDFEKLETVLQDISKTTYEYVDSHHDE